MQSMNFGTSNLTIWVLGPSGTVSNRALLRVSGFWCFRVLGASGFSYRAYRVYRDFGAYGD